MSRGDRHLAGVIGPARGLRGEVYVDVRTDQPELRFAVGARLRTDRGDAPALTVRAVAHTKGRTLVTFAEVADRDAAETLRGVGLWVEATREPDAWYPAELEGARVVDVRGAELGTLAAIERGAAQDLLVVDHRGREVRVPFVRALVPEVDAAARRIVVDPPGGLFDEPGAGE